MTITWTVTREHEATLLVSVRGEDPREAGVGDLAAALDSLSEGDRREVVGPRTDPQLGRARDGGASSWSTSPHEKSSWFSVWMALPAEVARSKGAPRDLAVGWIKSTAARIADLERDLAACMTRLSEVDVRGNEALRRRSRQRAGVIRELRDYAEDMRDVSIESHRAAMTAREELEKWKRETRDALDIAIAERDAAQAECARAWVVVKQRDEEVERLTKRNHDMLDTQAKLYAEIERLKKEAIEALGVDKAKPEPLPTALDSEANRMALDADLGELPATVLASGDDGAPDRVWCVTGDCEPFATTKTAFGTWTTRREDYVGSVEYLSLACHDRLMREAAERGVSWLCNGDGDVSADGLRSAILAALEAKL